MMRGAWNINYEYILELHTERSRVGCDGGTHVIVSRVLLDTRRGIRCESDMNKGGTARLISSSFKRTFKDEVFLMIGNSFGILSLKKCTSCQDAQ